MAQKDSGSLFPINNDSFGVGNNSADLFADTKPLSLPGSSMALGERLVSRAMTSSSRAPTKADLKAQAEADRQRQIQGIASQIDQMRQTPEWQDASLQRRNELYTSWLKDKYQPLLKNIQDSGLRTELARLPQTILKPDITALQKAIDDSSRLGDTWEGIKASGNQLVQGLTDYAPAVFHQGRADNLRSMLAQDGQPMVLGGVPQLDAQGQPVIQRFTPEQRAQIQAELAAQEAARDEQLRQAGESDKDIAANRAAQSIGQADRDTELREDQQDKGEFLGTLYNAATNPSNALQLTAEQLPNIAPAVALSTLGPGGAAAAGALLSGQDAMSSAIQTVQQMSDTQLQALPEYRALREQGMDEPNAKNALALRAGSNAATYGALVGLATGPLGAEAGAGALLNNTIAGTVRDVAGQTGARIAGGAALRGVGRTLTEGVEEGGTQAVSNLGVNQATGGDMDLMIGVGEAAAQGIIAGGPLGAGSEAIQGARDFRNRTEGPAPAPAPEGGPAPAPTDTNGGPANATGDTEGQITDIPSAAEAAAAEAGAGNGTAEVSPASPDAQANAINALRSTFDALRQTPGQALSTDEHAALLAQLHDAETAGVRAEALQAGLTSLSETRGLPDGQTGTLYDSYRDYVAQRTAQETQELAGQTVASFDAGDFINGTTTASIPGAGYTGPATRAGLDSELATPATADGRTAAPVPEDAGRTDTAPEAAGAGGRVSDSTTADAGNAPAAENVGPATAEPAANSGTDNRAVSDAGPTVSAGERGDAGGAGQRPANGRGRQRAGAREAGSNAGLTPAVGEAVQYKGKFKGAKVLNGEVTRVNEDGTFDLRSVDGTSYANLPADNIMAQQAAPVQDTTPVAEAEAAPVAEPAAQAAPDSAVAQATTERTGDVTPGGRDLQRMRRQADRLLETDYAADGLALSNALDTGDLSAVDSLADYLYAEGMRAFKPVEESTGRARTAVNTAYENELNSAERLALQREFDNLRNELPPEQSTFQAFRDSLVQDALLIDGGSAPLTSTFERLSQVARNIIQKLAKTLAAVVVAISLSNTFPMSDAVAATGTSTYVPAAQVQGLSSTANVVNSWVQQKRDNAGQRYIIADKASGEIHVFDGQGKLMSTSPALYGAKAGDGMSLGETPAGIFTLSQEAAPASYGGDLQQFATAPDGDILAIHRVLTTNPKQNRLGRLSSRTAADNRVSLGCINIPVDTYNKYLSSGFRGKLYIIPDQRALGSVFKGIEEIKAKQDLTEGQQLPADLSAPDTTAFKSSTATQAIEDAALPEPQSGASITTAAAEMDVGTSTSEVAGVSNDAADSGMAALAVLPLFAAMRNRRRIRESGRQGTTDLDTEPAPENGNTPTPGLGPDTINGKDFHRITATNPELANDNAAQRQAWMSDLQAKAVERLSDSDYRFVRWTGEAGLVAQGREFDSNRLVQTLKLLPNAIRSRQEALGQQYFRPISDLMLRVSNERGVGTDVVANHMGTWTTAQHIPEANRELRRTLQANVDAATFGTDSTAYQNAVEALRKFDDYQRGTGPQTEMAGGMTDAQARALSARIESYGYSMEDLQRFQQLTTQAFTGLTQERVQNGVLLQEEVDQWNAHNFQNYVALYVDKTDADNDVFVGTSNFNPAGDYTRKGSLTPANHSLVTLHQYLYRTAAGIESGRFKYEMHDTYNQMKGQGDTRGLQRVNLASGFISNDVKERRGFLYTERNTDEEGKPTRTTYKYYFDDQRITDGILKKVAEPSWSVMKGLAAVTNVHARFITKYDPSFAPINWVRDAWERATSLSSRTIYDADGQKLPLAKTAAKMYAATFNPVNVAMLAANMSTGAFANSRVVRGFNELKQQGGLSTYQHALNTSRDNIRKELRRMKGVGKRAAQLEHFFTQWNEAFSAAPSVGGYLALRDLNVPAREAAFRSLDVFNTNNRGYWTANMRAFAPFVTPAFEGGRNMLRNLSTNRGRALFASQIALGAVAYSMLLGAAPDDDDRGNLLDAMKLADISRMMPLFNRDGSYEKMPVSFGSSRLAWILGAGFNRVSRGVEDIGSVISNFSLAALQETQPADFAKEIYADNFLSGLVMSAMPSILTPAAEVWQNTNHFGGRIHGQKTAEGYASDAARAKTAPVWTDIAQGIQSATGMDMYPESVRHLFQAYLVGPTRAINTALEADTLYTTGGRMNTRQELGWGWDAVGLQRFWDNGETGVARNYYDMIDKHLTVLRKYHVSASDESNTPGTKASSAAGRVLDAGGTMEEAMLVEYAIQAETDRKKLDTQMKAKVKTLKKEDMELDMLAPDYEVYAQDQERMMRDFIRNVRGLQ